jgi:hypothetical protein
MTEQELTAQLQREGYTPTYVWEDPADKRYPDHTHLLATANIILSGEITITVHGAGLTFIVPAIAATSPQTQSIQRSWGRRVAATWWASARF